jgi:cell division protein FtsL
MLTSVLAPGVGRVLAGYQLQALESEQQRLMDERRVLELQEASLRSPARLEQLARERNLVHPQNGQIVHLDGKGGASLALNFKPAQ